MVRFNGFIRPVDDDGIEVGVTVEFTDLGDGKWSAAITDVPSAEVGLGSRDRVILEIPTLGRGACEPLRDYGEQSRTTIDLLGCEPFEYR